MRLHDAVLWWPMFWMQLIQGALIPRPLSRTNSELRRKD